MDFKPEKRRPVKSGEIEVMKGRGNVQKWFYVKSDKDAQTLIRLSRNSGFPAGITKGSSNLDSAYYIKEGTMDLLDKIDMFIGESFPDDMKKKKKDDEDSDAASEKPTGDGDVKNNDVNVDDEEAESPEAQKKKKELAKQGERLKNYTPPYA
jgi:hypothetical protein